MNDQITPRTDRLLRYIEHLSVEIGPRHPTSQAERQAAGYVHHTLHAINEQWELINQPFRSIDGFRYRIAPLAALAGLSLLSGLKRDRQRQILSGLTSVGLSVLSRDAFLARPAVWETWLARGESQNVIVRIPSQGPANRRVVFVAHLDSGVHRLTASREVVAHLPRTLGAVTILALVGGVLTVLASNAQRWRTLRALIAGLALSGAGLSIVDEMGPDVAGASGNASGVATLLELAALLHAQPLAQTEVNLVFTGSATAVATGADVLAAEYGKRWHDALWVVVSNVGAGELAWVTRHGISPYAYYYPHPDAVQVMEQVANAQPALGMMGKTMLSMDEVSLLRDRDLRAIALMGYDRATGLIPHWRQNSDTIHTIDAPVVARATQAAWEAAQVVDRAEKWPFTP
jgi:hypothetical protein